jgi:hypothetical protein
VYCETLSALEQQVSLAQLDLSEDIYKYAFVRISNQLCRYNERLETRERPPSLTTRQFGMYLPDLMGVRGERGLPPVIVHCIDHLHRYGTYRSLTSLI